MSLVDRLTHLPAARLAQSVRNPGQRMSTIGGFLSQGIEACAEKILQKEEDRFTRLTGQDPYALREQLGIAKCRPAQEVSKRHRAQDWDLAEGRGDQTRCIGVRDFVDGPRAELCEVGCPIEEGVDLSLSTGDPDKPRCLLCAVSPGFEAFDRIV